MSEEVKEQPRLSMKVLDAKIVELKAEIDALREMPTSEDGSQGLNERIAAIEVKLEALGIASTLLLKPGDIDLPALLAALRPLAGSMWRTPA